MVRADGMLQKKEVEGRLGKEEKVQQPPFPDLHFALCVNGVTGRTSRLRGCKKKEGIMNSGGLRGGLRSKGEHLPYEGKRTSALRDRVYEGG